MAMIDTYCNSKAEFENRVNLMIKEWEEIIKKHPNRAEEFENVIWGSHRILSLLKVDIIESNDII